ncbi:hypothetical protein VR45_22860, partial [Streptomyces sp. NRRL S-495]
RAAVAAWAAVAASGPAARAAAVPRSRPRRDRPEAAGAGPVAWVCGVAGVCCAAGIRGGHVVLLMRRHGAERGGDYGRSSGWPGVAGFPTRV